MADFIVKRMPGYINYICLQGDVLYKDLMNFVAIRVRNFEDFDFSGLTARSIYSLSIRDVDVFSKKHVWSSSTLSEEILILFKEESVSPSENDLSSMIVSENGKIRSLALSYFPRESISCAIENMCFGRNVRVFSELLSESTEYKNIIYDSLKEPHEFNLYTLNFISTLIDFKFCYSKNNIDNWVFAIEGVDNISDRKCDKFFVYLLKRAIGGYSSSPGALLAFSFDPIHKLLLHGVLEEELWNSLKPFLPKVPFPDKWDKANRLRKGVSIAIVDYYIPVRALIEISKHEEVISKIIKLISESKGGEKYLEFARSEINFGSLVK